MVTDITVFTQNNSLGDVLAFSLSLTSVTVKSFKIAHCTIHVKCIITSLNKIILHNRFKKGTNASLGLDHHLGNPPKMR